MKSKTKMILLWLGAFVSGVVSAAESTGHVTRERKQVVRPKVENVAPQAVQAPALISNEAPLPAKEKTEAVKPTPEKIAPNEEGEHCVLLKGVRG